MSAITASLVKELREKMGVGMMDAKKALVETDGNMEAAEDLLRAKGAAKAEKKSSRTAAEGLIGMITEGNKGAVVELNSETDFVARNGDFQSFVSKVTELSLGVSNDVEALSSVDFGNGKTVGETLVDNIATIGENMTLRRVANLEVSEGVIAGYMHNAISEGLGKIGVLVALESSGDQEKLSSLGKQIAMHVAASFPQCMDRESADADAVQRERDFVAEQARESGKPEEIIEKMVEGRMRKYFEEICLLEQTFVIDGETVISKVLENAAKDIGSEVKLTGFVRFQLGEGIEKEEEDFAAEVAAVANG
jgi:elongation factor Ts